MSDDRMGDVIKELWPILKYGREAVQGFIAMKQFQAGIEQIQTMAGHSQEQLDEVSQGILSMASDEAICVSDSDVCPMCNGLLDWMEECPHCGWDGVDEEDDEYPLFDDDYEPPIIGTPEDAYAVELSLSDAEVERLLADVD